MTTQTKERIRVHLSPDGLEAHIVTPADDAGEALSREEILGALEQAHVRFGVDGRAVDALVAGEGRGTQVRVAAGTAPVAGTDGWVEFLVGADAGSAGTGEGTDSAGDGAEKRVDLHELHLLHNVLKGDVLARIHPPQPGTPGTGVSGQPLAAPKGKAAPLHLGSHVSFADEEKLVAVASEDGNAVVTRRESIDVNPVVTITGNVDYSTGNIDFVGSLIVNGDVKSDFTIKVKKSLHVMGNVEDATIEAGGDVVVKKGFVGRGKGKITSGHDVHVQHVLNQTVAAENDIAVDKESVNGELRAGRRISAPRAVVAGGSLEADHEIVVGTLGNSDGVQARVRLGRRGKILERIIQLEKDIKHVEKQFADVKDAVYRLIKQKLDAGSLCQEKEESLKKLQEAQKLLPARMGTHQEEKARLNEELQHIVDARLEVHESVFENVLIEINGIKKLMDQAVKDVVFFERNGKIEIQPREQKAGKAGEPSSTKKAAQRI